MSLKIRMSGVYQGTITSELEYRVYLRTALILAIANYKKRMQLYIEQDPKIPVATGDLKQSGKDIVAESFARGFGFQAFFGFGSENVDYAKVIDQGRTARYPGREGLIKIRAWCRVIGFPEEAAEAIAWKLYWHDTPGRFFFQPGVQKAKQVLAEELASAFTRLQIEAKVAF